MKVDERLFHLAPEWAIRLEKINGWTGLKKKYQVVVDDIPRVLDAKEFGCCMVGEYNDFDGSYQNINSACQICLEIAREFCVYNSEDKSKVITRFEILITRFCDHILSIHGEV